MMEGYYDLHTHILPGMDDGAKTSADSEEILKRLCEYGFTRAAATSHFYFYRESTAHYIKRRSEARQAISDTHGIEIILAAELAMEPGISEAEGIENLAIPGTDYLLLELPMRKYGYWIQEETYNIYRKFKLKPLFAHIERYSSLFSKDDYASLLSTDYAVFQFTLFSFNGFRERSIFKQTYRSGAPIVIGSDTHRMDFRINDAEKGIKKLKKLVGNDFDAVMKGNAIL